jgi:hypothetical protein
MESEAHAEPARKRKTLSEVSVSSALQLYPRLSQELGNTLHRVPVVNAAPEVRPGIFAILDQSRSEEWNDQRTYDELQAFVWRFLPEVQAPAPALSLSQQKVVEIACCTFA